eukprot:TRINITY_DN6039_c1_g1_i2.p1 TRINITY_DN6039_c1_g1~~TRINITY_DN6039_c1_g1_i2.p1  ORF type:complete len:421 (+),score=217.03 TRINITY_DN6039_c1_g1_i2:25-1263(+)
MTLKNRLIFWVLALFSPLIVLLLTAWGAVVEFGLKGRLSLERVEKERQKRAKDLEEQKRVGPSSSSFLSVWSFSALELFCFQASLLYYLRPGATIISGTVAAGEEDKKDQSEKKKKGRDRDVHPKGLYADVPLFTNDTHARINCFSLALAVKLWNQPHYRSGTFVNDMKKNLRNVAVPGSGLPLSSLTLLGRPAVSLFLLFGQPLISLLSALNAVILFDLENVVLPGPRDPIDDSSSSSSSSSSPSSGSSSSSVGMTRIEVIQKVGEKFREQMARPEDWFWFWSLNCRLASYHSLFSPEAQGYRMEDKWTFLQEAAAAEIAVSPWIESESIVVKNTNEEGGLGIHFFRNATAGGPWIIQETLSNDESISSLLPSNAPLSTLRVMTSSRSSLHSPSHRSFPSSSSSSSSEQSS